MTNAYALRSPLLLTGRSFGLSFVRDLPPESAQRVAFHIQSGDYFGTLAAIMVLLADAVSSNDAGTRTRCIATLNELSKDLLYLQERAEIKYK